MWQAPASGCVRLKHTTHSLTSTPGSHCLSLQGARGRRLTAAALKIQAAWRGMEARQQLRRARAATTLIQVGQQPQLLLPLLPKSFELHMHRCATGADASVACCSLPGGLAGSQGPAAGAAAAAGPRRHEAAGGLAHAPAALRIPAAAQVRAALQLHVQLLV